MDTTQQDQSIEMLHELAEHLGTALYSENWHTREYAIAAFSRYLDLFPRRFAGVDYYENR